MVILITGASHTGKTVLAQRLLDTYGYSYLSIDHLKMGLIRSGYTTLTPEDDDQLTEYLWPVVREIIKTAIENKQNLTIEGCYIPLNWADDFSKEYLDQIQFICLVMSRKYIQNHFDKIKNYAIAIETRLDDAGYTMDRAITDNEWYLKQALEHHVTYVFIEDQYNSAMNSLLNLRNLSENTE